MKLLDKSGNDKWVEKNKGLILAWSAASFFFSETFSQAGRYKLTLLAKNSPGAAIPAGYSAFQCVVSLDGKSYKLDIPASVNDQSASVEVDVLSAGEKEIEIRWLNDGGVPGVSDANICIQLPTVSLVEPAVALSIKTPKDTDAVVVVVAPPKDDASEVPTILTPTGTIGGGTKSGTTKSSVGVSTIADVKTPQTSTASNPTSPFMVLVVVGLVYWLAKRVF